METKPKRYALHTTARVGNSVSEDCFYGWSVPANGELCKNHTVLRNLGYNEVCWIAAYLINLGRQVVVTDDTDWSELINDGNIAVYYSPSHLH